MTARRTSASPSASAGWPPAAANAVGPLAGLRVLDLADESGALTGKLLGDLGADVIAVEPPGGVRSRTIGPFWRDEPHPDRSLFHWYYGTSKRSMVLDLDRAEGRAALARLAAAADVLIETAPPGAMDRAGLGCGALAIRNPGLVFTSITPFGQSGPWRDRLGSDMVAAALAGMVYVNGFPDAPPLHPLGLQAFHSAAFYAAVATLAALHARERLGRGQHVDVSVLEATAAAVESVAGFYRQNGTVQRRNGSLHWTRYFRVARCRDGYLLHCTMGDWTSLIEWVKADGKAADLDSPAWEDFNHRRTYAEHLFDVLDEWVKDQAVADVVAGAQLRRIPYAMVMPPEAQHANEQLAARGFYVPVEHPELGVTILYPGAPYLFGATPWAIRRRPPLLGEHTVAVLSALGLTADQIAAARGDDRVTTTRAPGDDRGAPAYATGDDAGAGACAAGEDAAHTGARAAVGPYGPPPPATASGSGPRALDGVTVLDFTWVVAGPVATRILADQGARVIKVERRDSLDFGARRGGFSGNLNRGKESVVIAMDRSEGLELARRLVAGADVVIDNFSARVMRNWGLDYGGLQAIRPDIIAVSMSGFGLTGPHRDYVSYGPTLQALSGFTLLMREEGGEPAGWGYSYADMAGGAAAALATLAALHHKRRTGEGQLIDLAQFENACALIGPALLDFTANGRPARPFGNGSQERPGAPYGVYPCRGDDRWCAITVFDDAEWQRLAAALGHPPWTAEPRFASLASRRAHAADLDRHLSAWTRARGAHDAMETLQRAGVAAGVVANAVDLCERNVQLAARGYCVRLATPEGEEVVVDGVPFSLSITPGYVAAPGPLAGEHGERVLTEMLGIAPSEVTRLRAIGVIG
jgi:crotonobetainyl-CoA:carnitine CoA-transferase CaiB-like acyl-CoA transferase